jgi:nucleoside-diphosphate-sugar epimerase
MDIREGSLFVTGGAGTLGKAIAARRQKDGWKGRLTVYSRHTHILEQMKREFPDVTIVQGDIRDPLTLYNAMAGHDIVIHAGAVKVIPVSEEQPIDTIQVNVMGSLNVCDAAVRAGVRDVIAISTDKACLEWHSPVLLEDGTTMPIGALVSSKTKCGVKSYVQFPFETKIESRPITGWFKNKVDGRKMYSVSYEGAPSTGNVDYHVLVTEDHKFLTQSENGYLHWTQARDLDKSDDRLVTAEWEFNYLQESLLVGTMLGDASISKNEGNTRPRLRMAQAKGESEWLLVKAKALSIENERIHECKGIGETHQDTITASSSVSASLLKYFEAFYKQHKKVIPFELVEKALQSVHRRPVFLASWYLDDGCTTDNLARIATHGFTQEEVMKLAEKLTSCGFESYSYKVTVAGKTYYELRFNKTGSKRLYQEIAKYVPESMTRKIPAIYKKRYDPELWNLGDPIQYKAKPIVRLVGKNKTGDVYCIAVEQSENFIVNNMILHNCHPANAYGATKYLMEKIFQEYSRNWKSPKFHLVRYGNVLDSNGSVVEAWKNSLKHGDTIKMTNPNMTRFWISPAQAVNYVIGALEQESGCIYIPKMKALSLGRLQEYAVGECKVERVPLRAGEKIHETLLTLEESPFALDMGTYYLLYPTTHKRFSAVISPYSSNVALELTREELAELLENK